LQSNGAMSLSAAFNVFKASVFEYHNERKSATDERKEELLENVMDLVKGIAPIAKGATNAMLKAFAEDQIGELYRVYDILVKYTQIYIQDKSKRSRVKNVSMQLMHMLRVQNVKGFFEDLPTKLATEFCKGITSFNAGGKQEPKTHDANHKRYIERKIFDELYDYVLRNANPIHIKERFKMERYFEVDLNQSKIDVSLYYSDQIYPVHVQIKTRLGRSFGTYIDEDYKKESWNALNVKCTKTLVKHYNAVAVFHKTQSFDREELWLPEEHS